VNLSVTRQITIREEGQLQRAAYVQAYDEALEKEVRSKNIPIFDHCLRQNPEGRQQGSRAAVPELKIRWWRKTAFTAFCCKNII